MKNHDAGKTRYGVPYVRYIASWISQGGEIVTDDDCLFTKWLREKEQLTEEEVLDILWMAINGKYELEKSAREFIDAHSKHV